MTPSIASVLLVAACALALVAAACTSGDRAPSGTGATAEATPPAEATPAAEVTAAAEATATVPARAEVGVWVIDSETGETASLYEGDAGRLRIADAIYPSFTRSGTVWLADESRAGRFAPSGVMLDAVEGAFGVIESDRARERAYYLATPGGDGVTLVVENPLGRRRQVGEATIRPAFSPNGASIAYFERGEVEGRFDLVVFDTNLDLRHLRATTIELCQCEDFSRPSWSPSGDYIAYPDFGPLPGGDAASRGGYVAGAFGLGEPVRVVEEPRGIVGWLLGDDDVLVVNRVGQPALFDPETGAEQPLVLDSPQLRGTALFTPGGRYVQVWTPGGETLLIDPRGGEELGRWRVRGVAALTPFGPAIAVDGPAVNIAPAPNCSGVWIEHPNLPEGECGRGATRALWSPDGSVLAVLGNSGSRERWLEFWTFGEDPLRVLIPPTADLVEWSPDGRYLVSWGIGV